MFLYYIFVKSVNIRNKSADCSQFLGRYRVATTLGLTTMSENCLFVTGIIQY